MASGQNFSALFAHYSLYAPLFLKSWLRAPAQEVASGAAHTTLETLQEILEQLSQTNEMYGDGYFDVGKNNPWEHKSTMSDRASSQKAFNTLLSEYRA